MAKLTRVRNGVKTTRKVLAESVMSLSLHGEGEEQYYSFGVRTTEKDTKGEEYSIMYIFSFSQDELQRFLDFKNKELKAYLQNSVPVNVSVKIQDK